MQRSDSEDDNNSQEEEEEQGKFADLNDDAGEVKIEDDKGQDAKDFGIDYISDKSWEDLGVKKELYENLIAKGFKRPSKIQSNVLNIFNQSGNNDIVAQSQNGSGKTLSFLVPCLNSVDINKANTTSLASPQVIILADTKELAYQISKIANLIKCQGMIIELLQKDKDQFDSLGIHVLVTTMGSLLFMLQKKKLNLTSTKLLIIDEADKMVASDSNKAKLPQLFKQMKDSRIGLFSATLPEKCVDILRALKRQFTKIVVASNQELNLKNLKHYWVKCTRKEKLGFIDKFMQEMTNGSVIIFVSSKKFADKFARDLHGKNHKTEILLGDMTTDDRLAILDKFKQGKIKILISTNLISRGIDARKVSLVINLDLPYLHKQTTARGQDNRGDIDAETYLHRTGRTARFGDKGIALNIVEDNRGEEDLKKIEKMYGIEMIEVTKNNFQQIVDQNKEINDYNDQKRLANEELI